MRLCRSLGRLVLLLEDADGASRSRLQKKESQPSNKSQDSQGRVLPGLRSLDGLIFRFDLAINSNRSACYCVDGISGLQGIVSSTPNAERQCRIGAIFVPVLVRLAYVASVTLLAAAFKRHILTCQDTLESYTLAVRGAEYTLRRFRFFVGVPVTTSLYLPCCASN